MRKRMMMTIDDLRQFQLFKEVNDDKLKKFLIEASVISKTFEEGALIFLQNTPCDALYLLFQGKAIATMCNTEGKQVTIEKMEAPHVIAPAALFASHNFFPVNIQACSKCKIIYINKNSFYDLMHRDSLLMENYVRILSDKCIFLSHKINGFALQTLKGRLADYLLKHQKPGTQQEIGEYLGVARPSVARMLSEFIDEGLIKMDGRKIIILDTPELKKYC